MAIGIGITVGLVMSAALFIWWFLEFRTPQPTINDLKFPVAVFIRPDEYYIDHNPGQLTKMSIQTLNYVQYYGEAPAQLIDDELNLFQLDELQSTENSYYLAFIKGGHGTTKVSFVLKRVRDDGHTLAKAMLAGCVDPDLPEEEFRAKKNRIFSAQTLGEALRGD